MKNVELLFMYMWIQESRIDANEIDKILSKNVFLDKTPSRYTVISLYSPI